MAVVIVISFSCKIVNTCTAVIYINIERFLIIEYVSSISIFKCLNFILQDYICKMATIDIVEAERGRQNIICQQYKYAKLKSSLRKFYGRHHDLVDRYGISVSQMTTCRENFPVLFPFTTYHRVCNQMITKGAISGAGTVYLSGAPEFTPGCQWGSCNSIISFMCMCCRSFCFVFFLLAIVLSVLRFTDSDYPFGIFKLFLSIAKMQIALFHVCLEGMRYQNQYNAKSIIQI